MQPARGALVSALRHPHASPAGARRHGRRAAALCLLLWTLGPSGPVAAEKTALAVVPVPGDTLVYRLERQQDVSFQGTNMSIIETGVVRITALESRKDTLQFSVRFSGFEGSIKQGEQLMERKPPYDGLGLRASVSRRGEVLSVEPQKSIPAGEVEQLQNLVDNFFPYLADRPVQPGDSWVQTRLIPNKEDKNAPPAIDGSTEYSLDELKKKDGKQVAKILGKGKAKLNMPNPAGLIAGETEGDSEMLLAVETGLILEFKSSADFSGSMGTIKGSWGESIRIELQR